MCQIPHQMWQVGMRSVSYVSETACLCCWMFRLLLLLKLTVIFRLISLDVAGMM